MSFLIVFFISFNLSAIEEKYDIVIYGATSAGVMAAVQSSLSGKSVVLIEPEKHVGGMTSNGLGKVDKNNILSIGGLAKNFFHRVWLHYQLDHAWKWERKPDTKIDFSPVKQTKWILEPHVAEKIFLDMLTENNIVVEINERLNRENGVVKDGESIRQITMESGRIFKGKVFIDASYEGDLMAAAGVAYKIGRESNSLYGETQNGIHPNVRRADIPKKIDVYLTKGDPNSGLLPRIFPTCGIDGEGDRGLQSFNYRMCLTKIPDNCIPVEKPSDYDESQYEIIFRALEAGLNKRTFFKFDFIPNNKIDANNNGSISTDFVGANWDYIEADYDDRERMADQHKSWQLGLIWTLQNHPRIHQDVKSYYEGWGLPKDEFMDNHGWPYRLYIREARRMVSDVVITEHTALGKVTVEDPVGMSSYQIDSHAVKYFVADDGFLMLDGCLFKPVPEPFGISFKAIIPRINQCTNLVVPVCLSSSHVAYGTIRMEPVFMILGQSAAIAASLAIDLHVPLQELPYSLLREHLLKEGQCLDLI